jgi:hypothetical protein
MDSFSNAHRAAGNEAPASRKPWKHVVQQAAGLAGLPAELGARTQPRCGACVPYTATMPCCRSPLDIEAAAAA